MGILTLKLNYFRYECFCIVDESSSHHHSCIFESLSLLSLSVGGSSNIEHDHQRFVPAVTLTACKSGSVFSFFDSVLEEIRDGVFEEIGFVLGVDIGHIFENTVEVAQSFFLEVFGQEEIGFSSLLVLLYQRNQGGQSIIRVDFLKQNHILFDFLVVGVLDGKHKDQFQFEIKLYFLIFEYLPNSLDIILPIILANSVLLNSRHLKNQSLFNLI